MAKTKEELNAIKEELETVNSKLQELTEDELKQITGGILSDAKIALFGKFAYFDEAMALKIGDVKLEAAEAGAIAK